MKCCGLTHDHDTAARANTLSTMEHERSLWRRTTSAELHETCHALWHLKHYTVRASPQTFGGGGALATYGKSSGGLLHRGFKTFPWSPLTAARFLPLHSLAIRHPDDIAGAKQRRSPHQPVVWTLSMMHLCPRSSSATCVQHQGTPFWSSPGPVQC